MVVLGGPIGASHRTTGSAGQLQREHGTSVAGLRAVRDVGAFLQSTVYLVPPLYSQVALEASTMHNDFDSALAPNLH